MGAGGGLGHLALQIGGKGMGFRMIVSQRLNVGCLKMPSDLC